MHCTLEISKLIGNTLAPYKIQHVNIPKLACWCFELAYSLITFSKNNIWTAVMCMWWPIRENMEIMSITEVYKYLQRSSFSTESIVRYVILTDMSETVHHSWRTLQHLRRFHLKHIDGSVQERRNSIANTAELRLSCTNPSTWSCCQQGNWRPLQMKSTSSLQMACSAKADMKFHMKPCTRFHP